MLSAEDVAAVKVAVEICNGPDMKRKILYNIQEDGNHTEQLKEILKEKETEVTSYLGIPLNLHPKLMSIVFSVSMRMLNWAIYHKSTVELSREFIFNFLNSSFFTHRGIIDNTRAAEELMKCGTLSIIQLYKIACTYCLDECIAVLFRQISNEDKKKLCNPYGPRYNVYGPQQHMVEFWSYYLMDNVSKLTGGENIDDCRLVKAVNSGSVVAVQYCLQRTNLRGVDDALVDAAEEAVKYRTLLQIYNLMDYQMLRFDRKCLWVPGDYYNDILYFALSKMREDKKIEFLKKDIEGLNYEKEIFENSRRSRTLEYFLNWPYQNYFMELAQLVWDILPENNYAVLLLRICDKIESEEEYGEHKGYDYNKLLNEFWCQSPERFKTYVLSNEEVTYRDDTVVNTKTGVKLLSILLRLDTITHEYRDTIVLILATATSKERENMIYSEEWIIICMELMWTGILVRLDELVLKSLFNKTQIASFKRHVINNVKMAKVNLFGLVKKDMYDRVELFLKWTDMTDEEIILFKKELIYSPAGMKICRNFIFHEDRTERANQFCEWGLSSEENIREFKTALAESDKLLLACVVLVSKFKINHVDKFINWCFSEQHNINEFKNNLVLRGGHAICEYLITRETKEKISNSQTPNDKPNKFVNDRWAEIEKFLSWRFTSDDEKFLFKKELFVKRGEQIHFKLIIASKHEEASNFFAWLNLSEDEIRKLQRETLFSTSGMKNIHKYVEDDCQCRMNGMWANINFALNWCLPNEESVREFKSKYDEVYGFTSYVNKGEIISNNEEIILNKFYSVIEEVLWEKQTIGRTKRHREMETLMEDSPNKKIPRA